MIIIINIYVIKYTYIYVVQNQEERYTGCEAKFP